MKKFENKAADGVEKAIRRGFSVPPGAVNIGWAKAPSLSPKNNTIIIDTSRVSGENSNISTLSQNLAYANYLGVLEDEKGNQVWNEEYPIISDVFLPSTNIAKYGEDLEVDDILPYMHASRFFHVDFVGLSDSGFEEYREGGIKVVDKNGTTYGDPDGTKRYKVYLAPIDSDFEVGSRDSTYRVICYLDMNPGADELYLEYNKVEITSSGSLRNQQINYRELINPRSQFEYTPEESDILDHASLKQKIYSTKPINAKEKALNIPQSDYQGWKIHVPRKAVADPRLFQLFRWRVACEFVQPVSSQDEISNEFDTTATIKAGIIVPPNGNHLNTRANYYFYQLNTSDYNFSKTRFVNPINSPVGAPTEKEMQRASYWHVDIGSVSLSDLEKFDILIWAPTTQTLDISEYQTKIDHFVEQSGGTFIFETSSFVGTGTGLGNFVFSQRTDNPSGPPRTDSVTSEHIRFHDETPLVLNDEFSSLNGWRQWPPNVKDMITGYQDMGSLLSDAAPIAGWNLSNTEKVGVTPYDEVPNMRFQSILTWPEGYKPVLEGKSNAPATAYRPVLMVKRYSSGGNIFVSTACIFEDHLFEPNGNLIMRSMQIDDWNSLSNDWKMLWDPITSSLVASAELKLRYNISIFATIFKPATKDNTAASRDIDYNNDNQSVTVYSDWDSTWVIDPSRGVLSDVEIDKFNFILQSVAPTDLEPTWQRVLSGKTAGQLIEDKLSKIEASQPGFSTKLSSATKRYFIIVTNPTVQVPSSNLLDAGSIIRAWTKAYSPAFQTPYHLGAYKVRDEMIAGTGVGEGRRVYPPKSWAVRPRLTLTKSAVESSEVSATIQITATIKSVYTIRDGLAWRQVWTPGSSITSSSTRMIDDMVTWSSVGRGMGTAGGERPHMQDAPTPAFYDIDTYTDANYGIRGSNWPHWGVSNSLSVNFPRGKVSGAPDVFGVQKFLNQLIFFGKLPGPYVAEDSSFGRATANKVRAFQSRVGAYWVDGIVDAETFSLIGYGLMDLYHIPGWRASQNGTILGQWADQAILSMGAKNISDGAVDWSAYTRATWFTNGPSEASQLFRVAFNLNHPYTTDGLFDVINIGIHTAGPCWLSYLDVTSGIWRPMGGYKYNGSPGQVNSGIVADNWINIPVNARTSALHFQLKSNQRFNIGGNVLGGARIVGIRDFRALVRRQTTESQTVITPGFWTDEQYDPGTFHTIEVTDVIPIESRHTFRAGQIISIPALDLQGQWRSRVPSYVHSAAITSAVWNTTSLQIIGNTPLNSFFDIVFNDTSSGAITSNSLDLTFNGFGLTTSPASSTTGQWHGKGAVEFRSRTEDGVVNPYAQRYGWVSKEDGIKMICDTNGRPSGFPFSIPTLAQENVHYVNYILEVDDTDQTTYAGFWDNVRKEWVTNAAGDPVISYYDYVRRGPNNVFMAVKTAYELDTNGDLPNPLAPVKRPFKWAMPVYGVTTGNDSKIQIMPLNPDLSPTDIWPIKIKTGSFTKTVDLKARSSSAYTGWINDYQGSKIHAYYSVPEANEGPWSQLFGRPYVDVSNEQPLIIDDNMIQVRQYPIAIIQEPTGAPDMSDPWHPIFKVAIRQTLSSPWVDVLIENVKDYDTKNGTITLRSNLPSNDPRLVKVSYTSEGKNYDLKWDGQNRVNLNPYINPNKDWIDKPLYVYIVPEYVADKNYRLIPETTQERTVRVTPDASIFSPVQADYEPLSILLGVVYITTSFDINELSLLDTRKRGGGVSTSYADRSAIHIDSDVENFWDISPLMASSYQKGGFVIIRFPEEITQYCTQRQVEAVINRNITLGVEYKLETLDGRDLDFSESPQRNFDGGSPLGGSTGLSIDGGSPLGGGTPIDIDGGVL